MYHLASKIKDTRINKDIDAYLPAIYDVLKGMDREELIKKMVAVEFTRFYTYYSGAKDLNTDGRMQGMPGRARKAAGSCRKTGRYVTLSMLGKRMAMIGNP